METTSVGTAAVRQFMMRLIWVTQGDFFYTIIYVVNLQTYKRLFLRSYISFDILRRVMSDYFGYNILYVMNITDIDDKIIKRARQDYLYEKYLKEGKSLEQILDDACAFSQEFENDLKGVTDPDKKTMLFKIFNE